MKLFKKTSTNKQSLIIDENTTADEIASLDNSVMIDKYMSTLDLVADLKAENVKLKNDIASQVCPSEHSKKINKLSKVRKNRNFFFITTVVFGAGLSYFILPMLGIV